MCLQPDIPPYVKLTEVMHGHMSANNCLNTETIYLSLHTTQEAVSLLHFQHTHEILGV